VPETRSETGNFERLPGDTAGFNQPFSPSVMSAYFNEPSHPQQASPVPQAVPLPQPPSVPAVPPPSPVPRLPPATGPTEQPQWRQQFIRTLCDLGILNPADVWPAVQAVPVAERGDLQQLAQALARQGKLTWYQAALVNQGKADQLVLGNYVLLDKIGEGGFGSVFKARHRRMQRVVALKVLLPELMRDGHALERFQREVQAAAKLSHPNIVTAYDADEARGMHFLAMEFVDGPDLGRLVKKEGALPPERALHYVVQAAGGLAHAHAAGIVHRDVKPSNLLLDKSGVVKVSDLGLARVVQPERGSGPDPLTATRNIMGTVDFMAPEQALNTKTADHRADIYSLGCTLYVLLTARPVYAGDSALQIVLAHREQPIPQLPAHCASWQRILAGMMAKRVEDRYPSMAKVIAELQRQASATSAGPGTPGPDGVSVALLQPYFSTIQAAPLPGSQPPSLPQTPVSANQPVPSSAGQAPSAAPLALIPTDVAMSAAERPSLEREPTPAEPMASSTRQPVPVTGSQPPSLPTSVGSTSLAVPLSANMPVLPPLSEGQAAYTGRSATMTLQPARTGKLWWILGGVGAAVLLTVAGLIALTGRGKTEIGSQAAVTPSISVVLPAPTTRKEKEERKLPPGHILLPVPDCDIPCDISVWKDSFALVKVTHSKDDNQIVFLLKTKRQFAFTDDGFTAPMRFFDHDGVNLVNYANLKFEQNITTLKVGENTRLYLTLPDEKTLKKTKRCEAVIKGFFANPERKK